VPGIESRVTTPIPRILNCDASHPAVAARIRGVPARFLARIESEVDRSRPRESEISWPIFAFLFPIRDFSALLSSRARYYRVIDTARCI